MYAIVLLAPTVCTWGKPGKVIIIIIIILVAIMIMIAWRASAAYYFLLTPHRHST